jgi:DNA-binding transcriptional LysR family regulator
MHGSPIPWNELQLFLAIAESGSLSRASKLLKVTQPTISRQLAELEGRLGESLFTRSVSGVTLTAFGEQLVAPSRRMAEQAAELERLATGADSQPKGTVRVTAPPGVAYNFLAPFSVHLRELLPEVQLEIISTVSYLDLVRREADLAIRVAPLDRAAERRDLVSLASREQRVAAYATPEYIEKLPPRYTFADVGWIAWAPPLDHLPPNPQLAARVPGFRPVFASDDYIVQLRAAEAGVGAMIYGDFRCRFMLPSALVPLELSFGKLTSQLYLVAARSALSVARVKAVADALSRELSRPAGVRSKK